MLQPRRIATNPKVRSLRLFCSAVAVPAILLICRSVCFVIAPQQTVRQGADIGKGSLATRSDPAPNSGETPATFLDKLFRCDRRPIVLYDGHCNMCNKIVDGALVQDRGGQRLRFAALQSKVGYGILAYLGRSLEGIGPMAVVRPDGRCLIGSDAPLFVWRKLEGSSLLTGANILASVLVPKALRDMVYNAVALNLASVLGKREELRVGDEAVNRLSRYLPAEAVRRATRFIPDRIVAEC